MCDHSLQKRIFPLIYFALHCPRVHSNELGDFQTTLDGEGNWVHYHVDWPHACRSQLPYESVGIKILLLQQILRRSNNCKAKFNKLGQLVKLLVLVLNLHDGMAMALGLKHIHTYTHIQNWETCMWEVKYPNLECIYPSWLTIWWVPIILNSNAIVGVCLLWGVGPTTKGSWFS